MALPTAQLGSMASLNMPSHIPAVMVQKEPKLWEKAVTQLLAQAAGQALTQGVQNTMSREYAPDYGETPATFFERLVRGPNVSAQQAGQRELFTQQKDLEMMRERNANLRAADDRTSAMERLLLEQRGKNAANRLGADEANKRMELQALLAQINQQGDEARALEAGTRDIEQETARRIEQRPQREADVRLRTLQVRKAELENEMSEMLNRRLKERETESQKKEGTTVDSRVANFAKEGKQRPKTSTAMLPTDEELVRQYLAQNPALSTQQAAENLLRAQMMQKQVQSAAKLKPEGFDPFQGLSISGSADPRVEQILKLLGVEREPNYNRF